MRTLPLLLLLVAWAPPAILPAQESEQRGIFERAYTHFSQGNLPRAREMFQEITEPTFPLADYVLHYLGIIALDEQNFDEARRLITELKRQFPQSIWFHDADLHRAKIEMTEENYAEASAILRALRSAQGARSELAQESFRLEAQAQEALGNITRAYALYDELRSLYPHSRWTPAARKEQSRLKEKHPELFGLSTLQSIADEADRLVQERSYEEAEILYKKLLYNVTEADFRLTLLAKLSSLYLSVRKRQAALPLLEEIVKEFPETSEAARALFRTGQIHWNRNDNAQALSFFKQLLQAHPKSLYVDRARFAIGDILESQGANEEAIQFFSDREKRFRSREVRNDAAWRLGWLHYRTGDLPQALAAFSRLAKDAGTGQYRLAALYWQARTAEKLDDIESAKQLYRRIVNGPEESYYRALALEALARFGFLVAENTISMAPLPPFDGEPVLNAELSFHLVRARALSQLSLHRLAVAELDEIERRSKDQDRLRELLMREYFRNKAYARSLALANQLPASNGERNFYRFPLAYWDAIQSKAQERGLDPHLVLALIRQESLFDTRARSPASALGLMQLLPSTAARVARQIGLTPPSPAELFNSEINLTLGTQYLKDLLQRYSNNWFKAIAAYNAGETAVDRWEKEINTDDIEEFVERIPYVETRGYVKLVMRNHRIYKQLYENLK